jgi:hypothetical protein
LFIYGRAVTASELIGAAAAVLFWLFVHTSPRLVAVACCAAAVVALITRELSPFAWNDVAGRFTWIPFTASLEADSLQALIIFVEKSFMYAGSIWAARQARVRLRTATISVAVLLLVLEMVQTHIPNRSPESTDAVMAIIAGFVLKFAAGGTLIKERSLAMPEPTTEST